MTTTQFEGTMQHRIISTLITPFTLTKRCESVREAVGRRVKLTLRRKVQLEVKGDKVENRVLCKSRFMVELLRCVDPL
ncbi:hypothetical protein INR49_014689 [Caranx melampygus]|nr:hypothetical protein INR49_014689 [Caranx melampygus]